jgi:hypothetical protein
VKADRHEFLAAYLKAFYDISKLQSKPVPGAYETLSKKTRLSLITLRYAPSAVVVAELEHFCLAKYFIRYHRAGYG